VICENCGHDSPEHHIRTVLFFRAAWPPAELLQICPTCRHDLNIGFKHKLINLAVGAVVLGVFLAGGFAVVQLLQWLLQDGSM
jgi:hypothetical protein